MSLFRNGNCSNVNAYLRSKPCILAVDDHEDSLILITHFLNFLGFTNLGASSAQQTYLLTKEYKPDVILLDIVLPEMDGIELLQRLKQDNLTEDTTVIALTALALAEEREKIMRAGFDGYLVKPYTLKELEELICHHLQIKYPNLSRHNWREQEALVQGQK